MKKLFLLLLLTVGLTSISSADYLDNWSNDALCGWMENPSPPSYMVEEVKARGISCVGGIVINPPPEIPPPEGGTPSPINPKIIEEIWLEKYGLIADELELIVQANGSSMVAIYDIDGRLLNRTELILELIAINPSFEPLPLIPPINEEFPVPLPPDPNPPPIPDPTKHKDYRPGWKIQEGSNFWVIDETDPYWETESGNKQKDKIKRLGGAYAQENPGVDPPIPSYYATDGCSEGKQEPGASCNR